MSDKKEAKNTWVGNPSGRKQFWAAATAAGLSEDNVHEVFGVESMYDYPGTLAEAIGTIKQWQAAQPPADPAPEETAPAEPDGDGEPEQPEADDGLAEKLAYRAQQQPESPVLAWTKFETPSGFVWHVSVRAGLPPDLARLALRQTVAQIRLFEEGAEKMKWLPVADGRDVTALPQRPAAQPPAAGTQPPKAQGAVPPAATGTPSNGGGTFEAETLAATVSGGNTYWKVKGGKFSRWGVTIWPEVLEGAGFDANQLDALQEYSLNGYVAHYVTNESGKPQKVTALEPKAA